MFLLNKKLLYILFFHRSQLIRSQLTKQSALPPPRRSNNLALPTSIFKLTHFQIFKLITSQFLSIIYILRRGGRNSIVRNSIVCNSQLNKHSGYPLAISFLLLQPKI